MVMVVSMLGSNESLMLQTLVLHMLKQALCMMSEQCFEQLEVLIWQGWLRSSFLLFLFCGSVPANRGLKGESTGEMPGGLRCCGCDCNFGLILGLWTCGGAGAFKVAPMPRRDPRRQIDSDGPLEMEAGARQNSL